MDGFHGELSVTEAELGNGDGGRAHAFGEVASLTFQSWVMQGLSDSIGDRFRLFPVSFLLKWPFCEKKMAPIAIPDFGPAILFS